MKKVILSWSSGKDSAWALQVLRRDRSVELLGLMSTVNTTHDRVAMHAVRRRILETQAARLGLPLDVVPLPWPCSNEVYEAAMKEAIGGAVSRGATHVAFGDLFLEDVRAYRETQMKKTPLEPLFPIWGEPTAALARSMIRRGIEAVVTCIDPKQVAPSLAGRRYDASFLDDLPEGADPCGENGEFHTCVLNAPGFKRPIAARVGEIVERDGFVFADLIPEEARLTAARQHTVKQGST